MVAVMALGALGADVEFLLVDLTSGTATNRRVLIQPVELQGAANKLPLMDLAPRVSDAAGRCWVSNMVAGLYSVTVQGPPSTTRYQILVPETNGVLNARSLLVGSTNVPGVGVAYTAAASDARYPLRTEVNTGEGISLAQATAAAEAVVETNTTAVRAEIYSASNAAVALAVSMSKTNAGQRVYNVQSYGASGDGVTDDSAAILAAWTAWTNAPRGGVLYFPAGMYRDSNRYRINVKTNPGHPGNPEPQWVIRGDGSGGTQWQSTTETGGAFIEFSQIPVQISGITVWNSAANRTEKNGTIVVGNAGTHLLSDVGLVGWNVGFDGNGSAGGHVSGLSVLECGVGLRVSGYCDGWTVNMNARKCWVTGAEIGGTNALSAVRYARGVNLHIFGINNAITAVIGPSSAVTVTGYAERSTNGVVHIGHPAWMGQGGWDGEVTGAKINMSGLQYDDQPGIVLNYAPNSMTIENCSGLYGTGRSEVESMTAACDAAPIKFDNNYGIRFKKSTGEILVCSAKTTGLNWNLSMIGYGFSLFSETWGADSPKNFRLGQIPYDGDQLKPQVALFGQITATNSAVMHYGGNSGPNGKPYNGHRFWLGDPSVSGNGTNALSILSSGMWGNAYGLTNMLGLLNTNNVSAGSFSLLDHVQFIDRTANLNITGFSGKRTGYASRVIMFARNSAASQINVTWPAGTSVVNLGTGSTNTTCSIWPGTIGTFFIQHQIDVVTNVLFIPYGWTNAASSGAVTSVNGLTGAVTLDAAAVGAQYGTANGTNWAAITTNIITDLRQEIADTTLDFVPQYGTPGLTNLAGFSTNNPAFSGVIFVETNEYGAGIQTPAGEPFTFHTTPIFPTPAIFASQPQMQAGIWMGDDNGGFSVLRDDTNLYVGSSLVVDGNISAVGGIAATNLTGTIDAARFPATTNSIVGGISLSNQTAIYMLSITENTTLSAFGNVHASEFRTASLWVTNGTANTYTLTLPAGTSCPDGNPLYVTNGQRRCVSVGGIINFTNAISRALP